ncbi:unnamed protein product, partial [Fusarium graminearum]
VYQGKKGNSNYEAETSCRDAAGVMFFCFSFYPSLSARNSCQLCTAADELGAVKKLDGVVLAFAVASRHLHQWHYNPTLERGLAYLLGVKVTCVDKGVHKDDQRAVALWPTKFGSASTVGPRLVVMIMGLDGSRDHERSGKALKGLSQVKHGRPPNQRASVTMACIASCN